MSAQPNFVGTPRVGRAAVSVANTNRDGTGILAPLLAAGANGSRIEKSRVQARVATTAGMIRVFVSDGATTTLAYEIGVDAVTPSATDPAFESELDLGPAGLVLPSGWSLLASTHNAEAMTVYALGGDF